MIRTLLLIGAVAAIASQKPVCADVVTEWNAILRSVMQDDGQHIDHKANPGWSTRSAAMLNGAIYDVFQAIDRTHAPFMANVHALASTNRDAAVHQAAYELLKHCYSHQSEVDTVQQIYDMKMGAIASGVEKNQGMALGSLIANTYMSNRAGDHASETFPYTPGAAPGQWRPRPGQVAWGPGWGSVPTFAIRDASNMPSPQDHVDALPPIPALDSQAYADAYNQVLNYGALSTYGPADTPTSRTADQTEIGLFWAYDRAEMGPPGVMFLTNLEEIGTAIGNTPEQNARLFAMSSVAMADASIAAWDAKFKYNLWRPIAAIQEADANTNPNTIPDADWQPYGAPGNDPNSTTDDFTPPFPAWTSGHATMGAAHFKAIELFYGTNDFQTADAMFGNDPVTATYTLNSEEAGSGASRIYDSFTQTGLIDVGTENSPDGENLTSRVYLGVHWMFDQRDGATLGRSIANDIYLNRFQLVPEPGSLALMLFGGLGAGTMVRRRARGPEPA